MSTCITKFRQLLSGGDVRSTGNSDEVVKMVKTQEEFDSLVALLEDESAVIAMRAADAVEKITVKQSMYLFKHKAKMLQLAGHAANKEVKWHLAQIMPRLCVTKNEMESVWNLLKTWLLDAGDSAIVRVNALQSLYEMSEKDATYQAAFREMVKLVSESGVPSLEARLRKLKLSV